MKWWSIAVMLCVPALIAAAVYANTLSNSFAYDDRWTLDRLPQFSGASLWVFLRSGRGLTYLVHLLDQRLWGSWEPGFHLTNIILHSLASFLAACVTFVLTRSARAALLCGLLFAVHPVHTEVVALFSYRKDILAMIFVSLALICWLGRRRQVLCYLVSLSCLGLGLLSKEVAAVGLVPMLFLADLLPGYQHPVQWRKRLRRGIWRIIPIVVVGIIATTVLAGSVLNYLTPESIHHVTGGRLRTYDQVLATVAGSIPEVLRLLFIPITLNVDYSVSNSMSLRDPAAMLGILFLVSWIATGALLIRSAPVAAFAVGWSLLMYFPCSNILPLTQFFIAERYLYVPSFGICLLIACGIDRVIRAATQQGRTFARGGAVIFAMLLIFVGGARSFLRNRDWRDDYSIWSSSLRSGMDSPRLRTHLGIALFRQGQYEGALQQFERALWFNPHHSVFRINAAKVLMRLGRLDEAAEHCWKILKVRPMDAEARSLLNEISLRQTNAS